MTKPISPLLPIAYSKEVASAKQRGAPLVALESTIITHGMPYPGNIEMARSVEAIIREQGAVPATIAVIHGTLHIGLEAAQLEQLAKATEVMKVSRADLAFAIAERRTGATTVAATMIAAARAAFASSPPAALAACTAAPRKASIFQPISRNWPAPASSSSAPAQGDPRHSENLGSVGNPRCAGGHL